MFAENMFMNVYMQTYLCFAHKDKSAAYCVDAPLL